MKEKRIYKSSLWLIATTIIDKSVSVLTQPLANRILSVYENGIYGVYQTWQSILSIIITFNLFGGVLEVYLTKYKNDKKTVLSSLCSLMLIISLIFALIFVFFKNTIICLTELKPSYLVLMYFTIMSNAIVQLWAVDKKFDYSYKVYSIVVCGIFISKCFLSICLSYLMNDKVLGRILGLLIPQFLAAIIFLFKIFQNSKITCLKRYWKNALRFNLPLIPHYLSSILLSSFDRIMIQKLSSTIDAGLYTVAYSLSSFCLFAFEALNSAYIPLFYKLIKEKNHEMLKEKTNMLISFSLLFSSVISLLAPEGIYILGGSEYLKVVDIVPILISGIFVSSLYSIYSNVEFMYEKTNYIFPITIIGSALNIVLNYLCIPKFGYKFASYTTLISYSTIALLHYITSKRILGKDIFNSKSIFLKIIIFFIVNLLLVKMYSLYIIRYFIAFVIICVFFVKFYSNEIKHG